MTRTRLEFDPYLNDPQHWGVSMAQSAELMLPCLDAAGVRSVVEIGAFAGDLTRVLADWAAGAGARVAAIDPEPEDGLVALAREHPELELIRETSLAALPRIPLPDAVIVDGDHNYYTVAEELRLIAERAGDGELPLLLFHDVWWPHGRRDDYYAPDQIPPDARQPVADPGAGIFPGDEGTRPGGLPYPRSAAREGGPRNGVLTAVEDFVAARDDVRLVVVPVFFGFGVAWQLGGSGADELARILDPWDRNPLLERLEENRLHHLATGYARLTESWERDRRDARRDAVLRRLLESSAFAVAEKLSRLRVRARIAPGSSVISKAEIRAALDDAER